MANNTPDHWLLLRGLTRESAHWGDFLHYLQHALPNTQIHCLDLPGSGIYYQQSSPDSIEEITRQLRQTALEHGWLNHKVTLFTVSLGGMVAWEWMQQFPADIHRAILINSSLASASPFYHRLRWQSYGQLFNILRQPAGYARELAIIKLISNLDSQYEITASAWHDIQVLRPVSGPNALRQILAAARYKPVPNKPAVPVLLFNGLGDRLVAPVCSTAISKRWNLPLLSHPWAGHDLCIDDPHWVISQLQQWLSNQ